MSFAPGDVVILKSGGPRMTVQAIRSPYGTNSGIVAGWTSVDCMWFDEAELVNGSFVPEALELAPPTPEPINARQGAESRGRPMSG